ncbi:hypothetical protein AKJ16_DCAP16174 [Drosera capensis]
MALSSLSIFRFPLFPSLFHSYPHFKFSLSTLRLARTLPVSDSNPNRRSIASMASKSASTEAVQQQKVTAPYGSWKSPITADAIAGGQKSLGGIAVDGAGRLIWLESRPTESGRNVLVKEPEKLGEAPADVTPKGFGVRTLAQEYGGGAFAMSGDAVVFSNYKDQRLYKQSIASGGSSPTPITPDYGGPVLCYADGVFDPRFQRFITVMEDHRQSQLHPTTTIAAVNIGDDSIKEPEVLVSGKDFYAFPRVDPNGERLAWIQWSHPNMPWDRSELWVGYISENGVVVKSVCVAGGDPTLIESPTEPKWTSKGELFFITDRKNGFWNLYKWSESKNEVLELYSMEAEFARPLWVFGMSSYDFIREDDQRNLIACTYRQNGRSYLGVLDDSQFSLQLLDIPFTDISNIVLLLLCAVDSEGIKRTLLTLFFLFLQTSGKNSLFIEGASAVHPLSVAKVTLNEGKLEATQFTIMWSSSPESSLYKAHFSSPEFIEFPTEVPGQTAYAYFYPPHNHFYEAGPEEKPPLLLKSHGYGREYRERLLGNWGVVDVNDCCSCAKFLVDSGKVDSGRLCITGGSAGGYTTLAALAFKDTFKAGASLYGVADLSLLRAETHKFESHYIDNLVGSEKAYFERAPINSVDRFSCPIILFQGLDDKVVPPDQARRIYRALKDKGLPVALIEYEGEQHGFRKAENIKFTLEQQMVFFARLVGHFSVSDDITPIKIDNFD